MQTLSHNKKQIAAVLILFVLLFAYKTAEAVFSNKQPEEYITAFGHTMKMVKQDGSCKYFSSPRVGFIVKKCKSEWSGGGY